MNKKFITEIIKWRARIDFRACECNGKIGFESGDAVFVCDKCGAAQFGFTI